MTLSRTQLAARLQRLAGTLSELKVRVRMAIATETGKAVAEAVNDLVVTALGSRAIPAAPYRSGARYRSEFSRDEDDDRSEWADDLEDDRPQWARRSEDGPRSRRPAPIPRWPAVLALSVVVVKAWVSRRLSGWVAASIALAAGVAALAGGPIVSAGLALVGAAFELFPPTPC